MLNTNSASQKHKYYDFIKTDDLFKVSFTFTFNYVKQNVIIP